MKQNEAIRFLQDCEQNLRKVVADALSEGDYPSVIRISDWAKAVAALVAEAQSNGRYPPKSPHEPAPEDKKHGGARLPATHASRRRPAPGDYPKFFRRGNELIKVGWSKKARKEYNHRAPRSAVESVAATVKQVGARGKMFKGDAILPLKDATGVAVPDYQAYVALAWLRDLGLLEQRGPRAGYILAPSKQMDSTITAAWPTLPEWRG